MDDQDRQRIIDEARETLARLDGLQLRERETSFDEPREWQRRESPDDEVRYSEPTISPPPKPAAEQPPVIAEDYIAELIATVVADVQDEFNAKLAELRTEVRELRSIGVADLREQLTRTLAKCTELVDRLEKREPMRGEVIDLPPLPTLRKVHVN
jgi:hypothetical protein